MSGRHIELFPWRPRAELADGVAVNKTRKILVRSVWDLLWVVGNTFWSSWIQIHDLFPLSPKFSRKWTRPGFPHSDKWFQCAARPWFWAVGTWVSSLISKTTFSLTYLCFRPGTPTLLHTWLCHSCGRIKFIVWTNNETGCGLHGTGSVMGLASPVLAQLGCRVGGWCGACGLFESTCYPWLG